MTQAKPGFLLLEWSYDEAAAEERIWGSTMGGAAAEHINGAFAGYSLSVDSPPAAHLLLCCYAPWHALYAAVYERRDVITCICPRRIC